jgi:trehalose 6-phosphate synthase/phosphatase
MSVTDDIAESYRRAHSRLLLLDYDGTLAPLKPTPPEAKPTHALLELLQTLASDTRNKVVIISGRDHQTLEMWLGRLPLDFAAEHGLWMKERGVAWHMPREVDSSWKAAVRPVLAEFEQRVPGSNIEEKTAGLAWHYRTAAKPEQATQATRQLLAQLEPLVKIHELTTLNGNKIIEVKSLGIDKGTIAQHWLGQRTWDFILAAGDDTTDEDLFKVMPASAHTIKVGTGRTAARMRLRSVRAVHTLLRTLTG